MPVSFCDVTSSTAPVATAASMALPPCRRISRPASAASGSLVATMPWRARTSERPCCSQPCARDPGAALIVLAGCGVSADGTPKGFFDCPAIPTVQRVMMATLAMTNGRMVVSLRTLHSVILLASAGPLLHGNPDEDRRALSRLGFD